MVKIEKSEVVQRCIDGLRLNQKDMQNGISTDFIKPVWISNEQGRLRLYRVTGTSSAILTVPAGRIYKVLWAYGAYTCSATVGNRVIRHNVLYNSQNYWNVKDGTNRTAGTTLEFHYNKSTPDKSEVVTGVTFIPIPVEFILPAGAQIRMYDTANIDTAGDSCYFDIAVIEMSDDGQYSL